MMRSKGRARGAQIVFPEASPALGAAARAPSRSRNASGANHTSATKKIATGAGADDARIGGGRPAAADRRGERRLQTELACRDGAEEDQVARRPARRVEAHLALHDFRLASEAEPLACTHVGAQARAMDGPRRRHVNRARPEPGGTVAEVEV